MARATNWLSFSLSPMEMLRSSSDSQFVQYDNLSANNSSHYFVDNFYANEWTNLKSHADYYGQEERNQSRESLAGPQNQNQGVPKLEDFLGYSDSQTETQDSSLTHIYEQGGGGAGYFGDPQDLKAIAGFQAFSANSGSEVDDSSSIAKTTQAACGEFAIESSGNDVAFSGCATGALSLGVPPSHEKAIVTVDSDSSKKVADTFGQRTSIYRGVTRYR